MENFLKLLFPLFLSTENYDKVRQKLGAFAVYEIWAGVTLLRLIPKIDLYFSGIEDAATPKVIKDHASWMLQINLSGLIIALFVGLITYIAHFHDRISDVFSIRARFEIKHIFVPLSELVGHPLSQSEIAVISREQNRYMRRVFYKYTSSMSDKPLVDKHDIVQALDAWSWFWVGLEGSFYWAIISIAAICFGSPPIGLIAIGIAALFGLLMFARYPGLVRRARAQIEEIADNVPAATEVKLVFDAL